MTQTNYRKICFETHERTCFSCTSNEDIEVHHLDGDRNNNNPDNLLPLCSGCHNELHKEGLGGLEKLLKPVDQRSHIDPNTTTFQIGVSARVWEDWKMTVPRDKSLEQRITELIEADTEGRVLEEDQENDGNQE